MGEPGPVPVTSSNPGCAGPGCEKRVVELPVGVLNTSVARVVRAIEDMRERGGLRPERRFLVIGKSASRGLRTVVAKQNAARFVAGLGSAAADLFFFSPDVL